MPSAWMHNYQKVTSANNLVKINMAIVNLKAN